MNPLQIIIDINRLKSSLIKKAKKGGLYENFGQREVGQLEDKYSDCKYSCQDGDRKAMNLIAKFNEWCMNFDLSDLRGDVIWKKNLKLY